MTVLWNMVPVVIVGGIVLAFFIMARKSGKDAARADAATEALKDVTNANAPATPAELERVRHDYQRD